MFAGALRSAAKPQLRPRLALWRARPGGMHCSRPASTKPWSGLSPSATSLRVSNPIREIVDQLDLDKINPDKEMIPLSIGDPSRFGNMDTDRSVSSVVIANVHAGMHNGYPPADGFLESRQAVADLYTTEDDPIDANDVMLTSGCSHALQLSIEVLCNPGDVLLVPNPGFPLYKTIADYLGVEVTHHHSHHSTPNSPRHTAQCIPPCNYCARPSRHVLCFHRARPSRRLTVVSGGLVSAVGLGVQPAAAEWVGGRPAAAAGSDREGWPEGKGLASEQPVQSVRQRVHQGDKLTQLSRRAANGIIGR